MANLSSLTGSLGVTSPKQVMDMVTSDLSGPFKELAANLSPSSIVSNLTRETGIDELMPAITGVMGDLKFQNEESKKTSERQSIKTDKISDNLTDSKDILRAIKEQLEDIYNVISDTESAEDIAKRRSLESEEKRSSGVPLMPNNLGTEKGFFESIGVFFGLDGNKLITGATAGLATLAGVLGFFSKLALRAGAIAVIFSAIASLDKSDWENAFENISSSVQKWKDGKYIEAMTEFTDAILSTIKLAIDNVISEFSSFIEDFGVNSKISNILSSTAIGASLGIMFGPKGAIIGAIAGFAYSAGSELLDWLRDNGNETGADTLSSMAVGAGTGASIGMLFGPKGAIIGAIVGALGGLLYELYNWFTEQNWSEKFEEFKTSISNWWNDNVTLFKEEIIKPITDLFSDIAENPVGVLKDMVPDWMKDLGKHIGDVTIVPLENFMNEVFTDPVSAFKSLFEESVFFAFHRWVWGKTLGPLTDFFAETFSGDIKEEVLKIIDEKAPWLMNLGKWVYDTFIDPIVEIFRMIKGAASNIKQYVIDKIPSGLREFFGIEEESRPINLQGVLEEDRALREEANRKFIEDSTRRSREEANRAIRNAPDTSRLMDIEPQGGVWRPDPSTIRSRDITPESSTNTGTDSGTVIGSVTVDNSVNNTRSGSDNYGPLTTRPKNSRLDDHVRGGIGTMDFYGF